MPLDRSKLDFVRTAQRCVEEWREYLVHLDRHDERFAAALAAYRAAIELRNRLERNIIPTEA
jgi:hypothetical protein